MSYWVYENWVAESKAVIHLGSCRFCNEGTGTGRNVRGDQNGKWHGAFGSVDEADVAARRTGRPVRSCRCVPSPLRTTSSAPPVPRQSLPTAAGQGALQRLTEVGVPPSYSTWWTARQGTGTSFSTRWRRWGARATSSSRWRMRKASRNYRYAIASGFVNLRRRN